MKKQLIGSLLAGVTLMVAQPLLAHDTGKEHGHNKTVKTTKVTTTVKSRIQADISRLESTLIGVNTKSTLNDAAWRSASNESLALANRIYARIRAGKGMGPANNLARDLREHVKEMHKAAMKGDGAEAKAHANMALGVAYQLDDWAS